MCLQCPECGKKIQIISVGARVIGCEHCHCIRHSQGVRCCKCGETVVFFDGSTANYTEAIRFWAPDSAFPAEEPQ